MSHLQYQHTQQPRLPPQQAERANHSYHGIMDIRNLCQRLDVDSLKAKLPALPQLKLPKSLPKLRAARRIFRSSHENVSGNKTRCSATTTAAKEAAMPQQAQFINRTPQRISTISSLMHEQVAVGTPGQEPYHLKPSYRSAGSLDDDYYAPYGGGTTFPRASRPISPVKLPSEQATGTVSGNNNNKTLTQRLQRGYKSISELRLKHLFAKQTVIRRDNIEVQQYVQQYEAERRVEQMAQARRDRQIADNYDIHISTLPITRQNTVKDQEGQQLGEYSGDESGLETTPRKKKAGIAATRFAKVRQPPLNMPLEQREGEEEEEQQQQQEQQHEQPMRQALRQNLKRLRKSIKRKAKRSQDSDEEEEHQQEQEGKQQRHSSKPRSSTLRARLRHFASSEQLPQRWRKGFKDQSEGQAQEPISTAGGVIAKLNEKMQHFKFFQRAKPSQSNNEVNTVGREAVEIDDDAELPATYHHSDSEEDDEEDEVEDEEQLQLQLNRQQHQEQQEQLQLKHSTTAWSSESLEDDAAGQAACDYPRVLIHQQHTDAYESTLIIAVATTSPSPPSSAKWLPNEQIIAGFKEQQCSGAWPAAALYKRKSIDIFEIDGGGAAAFADFEEALRNAPVLRISADTCSSDDDADDSSSRVTKIRIQTPQIGNSCESLMEQQPLDEDEDQEEKKQDTIHESERPPSVSPPPPPLPQRRPPLPPTISAPIYDAVPPPLPISKPPTAAAISAPLARLPQRSVSMTRPTKPLVKTSSLRLTYNEQMHPDDVGKVNKLISRFEGRPRLCPRRLHSEELTICSDAEDEELLEASEERLASTVAHSNPKRTIIPDIVTTEPNTNTNNINIINNNNDTNNNNQNLALDRQNSNCSRSEYGSPLSYPHVLPSHTHRRSSTPTMPTAHALAPQPQPQLQSQSQSLLLQQRAQGRRSRRSMTRDDDNFYSFDSDEENSYYSISPSSSSRYVVEI